MGCTRVAVCGLIGILGLSAGVGCAGNGNGLDANGRPLTSDSGSGSGSVPLSADFASIQENIFTPICSVCHVGGGAPQGLRLDAANSYDLLVGVPSTEVPTILRVKPGDPDNSYIIQKLEGHAAVGAQMPLGGPYLSTTTIAFVRQWITDGAQPAAATANSTVAAIATVAADATVVTNATVAANAAFAANSTIAANSTVVASIAPSADIAASNADFTAMASGAASGTAPATSAAQPHSPPAAPAVVTVAPGTGEILSQSPPQILIGFDQALDLTRIDSDTARIEQLPLGGSSTPRRSAARVAVTSLNPRALMLWPREPLPPGRYRVMLSMNDIDAVVSTFDVQESP